MADQARVHVRRAQQADRLYFATVKALFVAAAAFLVGTDAHVVFEQSLMTLLKIPAKYGF